MVKKFNTFDSQLGESVILTDKAKLSLYKKSQNSGYSIDILEEVYRRGHNCWTEEFGGNPDAFAFDRVNSFISDGFAAQLDEDLRNWFNPKHPEGGWKRIDSKGNVVGPCAREPGEPKPKCMSNEKRAKLTKKERAAAVASKRRHDPVADRSGKGGKPINVSNVGKGKISEEFLEEKNTPTNPSLWSKAKSLARSKFDVYPSAYANGWAAKWYKSKGGGWKSAANESIEEACWDTHKQVGMKKKGNRMVPDCVPKEEVKLNQPTPSVETVAKKFNKSSDVIKKALVKGIKVEKEHTKKSADAREIALDHLGERPDYYTKLSKMEKSPIKEQGIVGHIGAGEIGGNEPHTKDFTKPSSRFIGSDELVTIYKSMTPGQIIKKVVREALENIEEGDVIRTKFATKNMQKRGIAGPKPIEGSDVSRLWATAVTAPDDGQIAYHGDNARIISKGKHTDIKHGAVNLYSPDSLRATVIRKKAPKKKNNVVDIKQNVKEATYQGREVPLNKPMKGDVKKSKVFVDPDGDGKAQKVNFGDKNLSIKKDQPARKRSYCARSGGIKGKSDVTSANYWSRKAWDCSEELKLDKSGE